MLVDIGLVRRVERADAEEAAALAEVLAAVEPALGSRSAPLAGGRVVLLGPGMFVNRGIGMGLEAPLESDDLDELERLSECVGVAAEVEVCPRADRSVLELTSARGFRPEWFRSTLVRRVHPGGAQERNDLIVIEQVEDDTGLATWQSVAAAGFGYSTSAQRQASDLYAVAAFSVSGQRLYVAHLDRIPVGVAALTVDGNVGTFGGMTTVPRSRSRGVQSALIGHRLAVAAATGCDVAVATAAPGGTSERNLLRHGFCVAYTKLGVRRP